MKFKVYGTAVISVSIEVDADDAESAIEAAYDEFGGLSGYAGNGGLSKLIGTSQREVSLDPDGEATFTEAEPA